MPITIVCPISKRAITEPVIYKGYIYDRPSLLALVFTESVPEEALTEERVRALPIDYFTEALLKFATNNADCDRVPVSHYEVKQADKDIEANILDQIYEDPIHHAFPVETAAPQIIILQSGVLCAVDGRLYQRDDIEKLKPPVSPMTRASLNLKNDFLVHPVYQHLIASLEKAKRAGKADISLSEIFKEFTQPVPQRIEFSDRPYVSSIFKDSNTHLAIIVMVFYVLLTVSALMLKLMLFTPLGAAALLGCLALALFTKDGIFSARSGLLSIRLLIAFSLLAASTVASAFFMAIITLSTFTAPPLTFLLVVIYLAVAALQLLINNSFFDKDAKFNLNKSSEQINVRGVISLVICLLVTAVLSVGVFFTLSSLPFAMTAVVTYLSLAIAVPAIFKTLYQTIYNLRCSDFFTQLFSGNINLKSFKGLLKPEMVVKVILIVMSACLLPSLFPVLGLLGTATLGISVFLMSLNLFDFRRNSGELEYRKTIAAGNVQADATPLAKIELRETNRPALLEKISQLKERRAFGINADSNAGELMSSSVEGSEAAAVTGARGLGSVLSRAGFFSGGNAVKEGAELTPLLADAGLEEGRQLRRALG